MTWFKNWFEKIILPILQRLMPLYEHIPSNVIWCTYFDVYVSMILFRLNQKVFDCHLKYKKHIYSSLKYIVRCTCFMTSTFRDAQNLTMVLDNRTFGSMSFLQKYIQNQHHHQAHKKTSIFNKINWKYFSYE